MADVPLHRLGMQQKILPYLINLTSQRFRIWILALSVLPTNVWRNLVGAVSFHTYIHINTRNIAVRISFTFCVRSSGRSVEFSKRPFCTGIPIYEHEQARRNLK